MIKNLNFIPPEEHGEGYYYPADIVLVNQKIDEAVKLLVLVNNLLAQAASGGKHDTGCFADEFPDDLNKLFAEVQRSVLDSIAKNKRIEYWLKNNEVVGK